MLEQNKKLAGQVFEDIQSQGNTAVVDKIVAGDYVGHTPPNDIHGPEGAKQFDAMLRMAFPDFQFAIEDQIAEGDRVVTRWAGGGTHSGEFLGAPATGRYVTLTGITIFHIIDGKLRDGWTNEDLLGFMTQLGAVPEIPR